MSGGDAATGEFADIVTIPCDNLPSAFTAGKLTLAVFEADGLPVGQVWLKAGEALRIPPEIAERLERRRRHPIQPSPATTSSLVICTRDRPEELQRCLAGLHRQSVPPGEVIVVDNASRAATTRDVALAAGVTYLREDRPGLDFARNTGATAASGEIVIYADDDTELHPRLIEHTLAAFDDPKIVAMTGLVLPATLRTEAQWLFEDQWSFGRGYERIDYDQNFYRVTRAKGCPAWTIGAGANMAFRRTIFDAIGLFDERLDVGQAGCSGDSEYWYRILAAGYTCRYEPTAVVWHHHRLEMAALSSQIYHYMRGHTAALMVQFERTGDLGNLYRAFVAMPYYYARRCLGRLVRGTVPSNRFLAEQVKGSIAGIWFYLRAPRLRSESGS
jgi:GT2 family glycosyltransferase